MGNKLKTSVNRKLNICYALIKKSLNSKVKESKKNLVFIDDLGLGDLLCSLDALKKVKEIYPTSEGHIIYVVTSARMQSFLVSINCTYGYKFIILEFNKNACESFFNFKKDLKKLNIHDWNDVLVFNRIGQYFKLLLVSLKLKHVYHIDSIENIKKEKFINKRINSLMTGAKLVPIETHCLMFDMHTALLKAVRPELNLKVGVGSIPVLESEAKPKDEKEDKITEKYCVVSSGIASANIYLHRAWNAKCFAKVIDYIINNFHLKVYLCGSKEDQEANLKVYELVEAKTSVIDVTGKTNIKEWVELTRNAEFVFGNDSGYIHLAAAVKTQAFVILGFWNYGRFYPYPEIGANTTVKNPILITTKEPACSRCNVSNLWDSKKQEAFKAQKICKEMVSKIGIYKCIEDISSEDAIKIIKEYYQK